MNAQARYGMGDTIRVTLPGTHRPYMLLRFGYHNLPSLQRADQVLAAFRIKRMTNWKRRNYGHNNLRSEWLATVKL